MKIYNTILNILFLPVIIILFFLSVFYIRLRRTILYRTGIFKVRKFKKRPVWFHCSSLGEFNAIQNVILNLKKKYNDIFITTLTDTGYNAASKFLGKENVTILPLDFNFLMKRFIKKLNPRLLVIEETEIWPNLIIQTRCMDVPVIYTNCIISNNSFRFYDLLKSVFRNVLKHIDVFFVQNDQTAEYLKKLKVIKSKIKYIGNIKFDLKISVCKDMKKIKQKFALNNKIILTCGSTRKGEEKILLDVYIKLKKIYKNLILIIVPRHLNRVNEIMSLIRSKELTYRLYSKCKNDYDVLLVDKMGVLIDMYQVSDISYIGGTLVPVGGHNPIEAAYVKKGIICGKYIKNNNEAFLKIIENNGGFLIKNEDELCKRLKSLFSKKNNLKNLGLNAYKVIKNNQGASNKIVQYIEKNYIK